MATSCKKLAGVFLMLTCFTASKSYPTVMELHAPSTMKSNTLANAINDLSRRIMSKFTLPDHDVNIVLSPISVASVLGMMTKGAGGRTRIELEQACGFGGNFAENFKVLNRAELLSPIGVVEKGRSEVILANGLFYDSSQCMKSNFLNLALEYFQAEAEPVDFRFQPEDARKHINDWVRNKTRDMIKDILPDSEAINSKTRTVIMNAVYFTGAWKFPFHTEKTIVQPFISLNGQEIQVPMMRQQVRLTYRKMCSDADRSPTSKILCTTNLQPDIIELPYRNGRHVMVILVPNEKFSFDDIEANMQRHYAKWRRSVIHGDVDLSVPKFEVTFESDLKAALRELGIVRAFDKTQANFNIMSRDKISFAKFIHKSAIIVDESGTTAAAASGAIGFLKQASSGLVMFQVNRPFYFFIENKVKQVHLFAGRITDPTKMDTVL